VQRLTADTNIIVSGLNFPGNARQLLASAEVESIRLCVSPAILEEVADVLRRDKFGWSEAEAHQAVEWISHIAEVIAPKESLDLIKSDPDDNRILECAIASRSDYVVSGDKHLLNVKTFQGMRIVKVAEFMEILHGQSR